MPESDSQEIIDTQAPIDVDILTQTADRNKELPKGNLSSRETKFDVPKMRESTRSVLAKRLLQLLGATVAGIGVYIVWSTYTGNEKDSHRELITVIWTSQVTLASGALGYYFGNQENNS